MTRWVPGFNPFKLTVATNWFSFRRAKSREAARSWMVSTSREGVAISRPAGTSLNSTGTVKVRTEVPVIKTTAQINEASATAEIFNLMFPRNPPSSFRPEGMEGLSLAPSRCCASWRALPVRRILVPSTRLTSPLSSETTMTLASDSSARPSAARWRVP